MSKIITNEQLNLVDEAEPTEILAAVHKRLVMAEKGFGVLKGIVQDFSVELEMIKERISKLEERNKEEVGAPYNSVYGEDEQEESK